jgi:SAM-dependent methyltransferase
VADPAQESIETDLASKVRPLLRPGMAVGLIGGDVASLSPAVADAVGPSGRVVAVEPEGEEPDVGLPERLDLAVIGTDAAAHRALRKERRLIDRSRPILLVGFRPQALRDGGTDPVAILDDYRSMGLRARGAGEELPEDPGELVLAVDAREAPATALLLEPVDPDPPRGRRGLLLRRGPLERIWARRFPPVEPGTLAYDASHRALVSSLLDYEEWRAAFADDGQIPALGAGFDERVVEYPWLFSRRLSGRVLDAGSVLNHRHVLDRLLPEIDDLTIVTLAPEPTAFTSMAVSYLYADLRDLPLRDSWFDEVVCLSTIEHVGMDNTIYGADSPRAEDPRAEAVHALRELLRVVRPGGRIHLSVPFGRREDGGWYRQFDREDVDDLLAEAAVEAEERSVFRHTSRGWRRSSPGRVARVAYNPPGAPGEDGAVAARAVLCLTIRRPD